MVTWAQIERWKASSLDGFLDMLISARKRGMAVGDYISQTDVSTGWRGAGAEAAQDRLNQIEASCEFLLANIGDLIMATATAQDGVGEVELLVNEALSWAGYWKFSISEHGEVIDPHPYDVGIHANPEARELADEHNTALKHTRMAVDAAMSKADEVDRAYQQALAKIANGEVSEVEALDDTPGVPDAPPENASTEQVAAWWNSLTEAERNALFDKYYRRLGNFDGIDAATRDKANRRALEEDYRAIEEELEELDKRFGSFPDNRATGLNEEPIAPGDSEKMQRWSDLHHRKTDIEAIRNALNGVNGDTQLLLYEPRTGEPGHTMTHAAIAVGDVDTADNVATYVPGMTTTVAKDIESMVGDMERLKQHSEQVAGNGETVAGVAWIGYDAPPTVASAALPERAEAGGAALAPFLEGIEDSRHAGLNDVHQSLLGHSYGSTTSSYGLTEVRPGVVDDYAAFGSPGTQPGYDLNVPDGHNFVLKNREDPVTYVGDTLLIHGDDPADDSRFTELDANTDLHLNPFGAHSTYFEEDSVALDSLSRVAAGKAG